LLRKIKGLCIKIEEERKKKNKKKEIKKEIEKKEKTVNTKPDIHCSHVSLGD
jgi:AAA15 family ATPase/GTPase